MTRWKDAGKYGRFCREIVDEGNLPVCDVWMRLYIGENIEPLQKARSNFRLILQAPVLLEALCDIRDAADCYMQPLPPGVTRTRWERVRNRAVKAIEATKEDGSEKEKLV